MKITPILKKALIKILRRSPATLDLVMDVCTDIILERTDERFARFMAEETGDELIAMILKS